MTTVSNQMVWNNDSERTLEVWFTITVVVYTRTW